MYSELTASTLTATLTLVGGSYFGYGCFPSSLYGICYNFIFGCSTGLELILTGSTPCQLSTGCFGTPLSSSVECDPFALSYTFDPTSPRDPLQVTSVVISSP
jgi:hypothetical protein